MADLGKEFNINISKGKANSSNVYKGQKYRISILSNSLIRFEYSEDGSFNDYPTFFARNRSFGSPKLSVEEDNQNLIIKNDIFTLEYLKEKSFFGSRLLPEQNLKVTIKNTEKIWYFNHPEARNFNSCSYNLDDTYANVISNKGLFSLDGFVSFDDSKTPILSEEGNVLAPNYNNIDTYLFIYDKDFGVGLRDYFCLTGMPPLIPRYALGNWWAKDEEYNELGIQTLVNNFKKNNIPFSVLLLGEYSRTKNEYSNLSFSFDKNIFPNSLALNDYLHKNGIFLGTKVNTVGELSKEEVNHGEFIKLYSNDSDKNTPINVFDVNYMNAFLRTIINPYLNSGVDFLELCDKDIKDNLRNYTMSYYLYNNFSSNFNKRNFLITRNYGIAPHQFGALYSGNTLVSWKTLKNLPFYNANSANIGISWWAHDIGGYKGGSEVAELYMRYVQLGVFSPILRLSSEAGKYYKREPWNWDVLTFGVVQEYLNLRHRLIPYLYSEAFKYSAVGSPIVQPLYYKYPETYDEPLYKNEYYFGSELFVSPIVTEKDSVMNRVVHRLFLPKGVWYDFKTGKKYPGGVRGVSFYKDEDYPVFARTGAIIPLAKLDSENINSTSSPKTLEIHIFPGRSNTYKLYEDDGFSNAYKQGYHFITEINYYYKENDYSVSLEPFSGKTGIIPDTRNYIIRFRNTKFTKDVQVFSDEVNVEFESYVEDNDFVVKFNDVKTNSKVLVYCKGKDIEIDASRAINDDIEGIINDLTISTKLKVEIDKIVFSDMPIKDKRIAIRKLRKKGLESLFIKMFLKLFEYIAEI